MPTLQSTSYDSDGSALADQRALTTWETDLRFCTAMLTLRARQYQQLICPAASAAEYAAELDGWRDHVEQAQAQVDYYANRRRDHGLIPEGWLCTG